MSAMTELIRPHLVNCLPLQVAFLSLVSNSDFNRGTTAVFTDEIALIESDVLYCLSHFFSSLSPIFAVSSTAKLAKEDFPCIETPKNIIIIVTSSNRHNFVSALRGNALWNPRAFVLVITESTTEIHHWIKAMWKSTRALDVTVMLINEGISFYTWFPYKPVECDSVQTITKVNFHNIFPPKQSLNFNRCPVRVTTSSVPPFVITDYTGVEPRILFAIAAIRNLSVAFVQLPPNTYAWEWIDEKGEIIGAIKMLLNYEIDVIICGNLRAYLPFLRLDLVVSHSEENLVWFVPAPRPIGRELSAFKTFTAPLWLLVFSVLLCTFFIILMQHTLGRKKDKCQFLMETLALSLNQSVKMPEKNSHRLFLTFIFIFILHISTAYQSSLILFLTYVFREKPLETIEEVAETNLTVVFMDGYAAFVNESQQDLWRKLLRPGRALHVPFLIPNIVAETGKHVLLGPRNTMNYFLQHPSFFDKYGYPLVAILPDPFFNTAVNFFVSPGTPLLFEFNKITQWLIEAGLPKFWRDKCFLPRYLNVKVDRRVEPFGLANLEGPFFLLISLLILSFVVLMLEWAIFLFVKRHNMRLGKILSIKPFES